MSSDLSRKVAKSIERIKAFCPEEGYHLSFSGGKDSVVCKALLEMAGVKYDAHYRVTSVDPPELTQFIREVHPDVARDYPTYPDGKRITMFNLIPRKGMPPTRCVRYCCEYLKESAGNGRMVVTGVRWAESASRRANHGPITVVGSGARHLLNSTDFTVTKKSGVILTNDNDESRRMIEQCYKRSRTTLNPIIEWSDEDVWGFIRGETIPYCSLYDEGWSRLGCIGCPMAGKHGREREFLRWPAYRRAYIATFDRMLERRRERGLSSEKWPDGLAVYNWWMEYDVLPGQIDLLEDYDDRR